MVIMAQAHTVHNIEKTDVILIPPLYRRYSNFSILLNTYLPNHNEIVVSGLPKTKQ